jgi:hypothetical protein
MMRHHIRDIKKTEKTPKTTTQECIQRLALHIALIILEDSYVW